MADYWLSFRIDDDSAGGRTSAQRRQQLYNFLVKVDQKAWVDTTSFAIFTSQMNIDALANNVKMLISPQLDTVLIRQVNAQEARAIGRQPNIAALGRYMPYVETI